MEQHMNHICNEKFPLFRSCGVSHQSEVSRCIYVYGTAGYAGHMLTDQVKSYQKSRLSKSLLNTLGRFLICKGKFLQVYMV